MVSKELWDEYLKNRNQENRNKIIEGYQSYVEFLVNGMMNKVPEGLSKDDLIQCGQEGLIEAVERYSPISGNKFETYAKIRIQGSVSDQIRYYKKNNLGIARIKSTKIKEILKKKSELEQSLSRTPTKKEIANALDMDLSEYEKILHKKEVKMSYDEDFLDKKSSLELLHNNENAYNPEEHCIKKEEKEFLKSRLEKLNEVQKKVIEMYYFEEKKFKEIGKILDLTESRVSQIHKKAIFQLKFLFENRMKA